MHHPHLNSPGHPTVEAPTLTGRIEAALMTLACQGVPGLATKMSLMHPSAEVSSLGCSKFATIVLTQTIAALVETLPIQRSEQIQRELEAYLAEFYGPR